MAGLRRYVTIRLEGGSYLYFWQGPKPHRYTLLQGWPAWFKLSTAVYECLHRTRPRSYLAEGRLQEEIVMHVETESHKGPHPNYLVLPTASDSLDASHPLKEHL